MINYLNTTVAVQENDTMTPPKNHRSLYKGNVYRFKKKDGINHKKTLKGFVSDTANVLKDKDNSVVALLNKKSYPDPKVSMSSYQRRYAQVTLVEPSSSTAKIYSETSTATSILVLKGPWNSNSSRKVLSSNQCGCYIHAQRAFCL